MAIGTSFSDALADFAKKSIVQAESIGKYLAHEGFIRLVERSPIDTKRFRDSWRVEINGVDDSVEPPRSKSHHWSGEGNMHPATADETKPVIYKIARFRLGDQINITNSLKYAGPLENGHSPQCPPGGMIALTIAELAGELERMREGAIPADVMTSPVAGRTGTIAGSVATIGDVTGTERYFAAIAKRYGYSPVTAKIRHHAAVAKESIVGAISKFRKGRK